MKLIIFLLLTLTLPNLKAMETNELIVQGLTSLSFDDVDGYASTIPNDKQDGFFESPLRIDTTLNTLLTMKHVTNYAKKEKLLNEQTISKKVSDYLYMNSESIAKANLSDFEYLKLKQHLEMKYSYMFMQSYIKDLVRDEDLINLAEEQYELNKESYYHKALMDIQYVNIKYNSNNKQQQLILAEKIQSELKLNNLDFTGLEKQYVENSDVEFISNINDYFYNSKYKDFSDYIFKSKTIGLHKDIMDAKSRFIVAVILKTSGEGYKSFDEVKSIIIASLKKEKVERDFGDLVLRLTNEPIEINQEAIISLKTRYSSKDNNIKNIDL